MSAPKIPLAVIGCGAVAAGHYLPCLTASSRLSPVLLVDRNLERARSLATRWHVPAVSSEIADVARHARAAVVALPNHLHAPVAIELLSQGVHVLVEKPMATRAADCDAMAAAAAAAGAVLDVGLQFRFFDSTRWIHDVLRSDLLGSLRRFEMRLGVVSRWPFASDYFLRPATAGGGVLVDYGAHVLDLLLHWLGDFAPPRYRDDAMGGVESDCEIELTTLTGVPGRVEISRTRNLRNTCVFEGDRATVEVGVWDPDPAVSLRQVEETACRSPAAFDGMQRRASTSTAPSCARSTISRTPSSNGVSRWCPAREGRRAVELIEACYAARQPLELPWMRLPGGTA